MANKLQFVSELADQTARGVTRNADGWKQYLTTAARLYKYSFDDQLLIYAQRPDAAACASMELWNETMRRWVKPGSRGIALIKKGGGGHKAVGTCQFPDETMDEQLPKLLDELVNYDTYYKN